MRADYGETDIVGILFLRIVSREFVGRDYAELDTLI